MEVLDNNEPVYIEDFRRNGTSARQPRHCEIGNGWVLVAGRWQPLVKARFTADRTPTNNINAGEEGTFTLQLTNSGPLGVLNLSLLVTGKHTPNAQLHVDASRDAVFIGRERHVATARAGQLPYPQRAIRTKEFLFIINFRPDRFPLGDPYRLDRDDSPTAEELTENTFATLPDEDAGPTKAWMVLNRKDPRWKPSFEHAYGKRPREELFDLRSDPDQMKRSALACRELHTVAMSIARGKW